MGLQNHGSPNSRNFGSPGTKCHLNVAPVERHREYYKGEGGGFPQVRAMMNLVNPSLPVLVLAPKVPKLCTNQLVIWFVQFHVSDSMIAIVLSLVPELQRAPLPLQSAVSQGTCPDSLFFRCFMFGTHI
jgi:hypothetical protein